MRCDAMCCQRGSPGPPGPGPARFNSSYTMVRRPGSSFGPSTSPYFQPSPVLGCLSRTPSTYASVDGYANLVGPRPLILQHSRIVATILWHIYPLTGFTYGFIYSVNSICWTLPCLFWLHHPKYHRHAARHLQEPRPPRARKLWFVCTSSAHIVSNSFKLLQIVSDPPSSH